MCACVRTFVTCWEVLRAVDQTAAVALHLFNFFVRWATPSKFFVSRPARAWLCQKIGKQNKKIACTFQSLRPAGYSVVCGPEVHVLPPTHLHPTTVRQMQMQWCAVRCSPWKVAKFVLWCSFSPQVKMPLVRVGIDLEQEIDLDWFVLQTQLQDQTFL